MVYNNTDNSNKIDNAKQYRWWIIIQTMQNNTGDANQHRQCKTIQMVYYNTNVA